MEVWFVDTLPNEPLEIPGKFGSTYPGVNLNVEEKPSSSGSKSILELFDKWCGIAIEKHAIPHTKNSSGDILNIFLYVPGSSTAFIRGVSLISPLNPGIREYWGPDSPRLGWVSHPIWKQWEFGAPQGHSLEWPGGHSLEPMNVLCFGGRTLQKKAQTPIKTAGSFKGSRYIYILYIIYILVGGWTNPIEKICSSKWESSPSFGVKIKNIWVATTQYYCIYLYIINNRLKQRFSNHSEHLYASYILILLQFDSIWLHRLPVFGCCFNLVRNS